MNLNEATTLNVSTVHLKEVLGAPSPFGRTVTVNADTTINADVMGPFGGVNNDGVADFLAINGQARLRVNLTNPNGEWTINAPAIVNMNASDAPLVGSSIDGADVNIDGAFHGFPAGSTGTHDSDGILNVVHPWDSILFQSVNMAGGEIRGGTITNNTRLEGFGLVTARVINNSSIRAQGGGTLILETADNDNDWDGANDFALLYAIGGNLELRDNAAFPFFGSVLAQSGREVFANGFALQFEPASLLTLLGGTYRSSHDTQLGGTVDVAAGGPSTLQISGTAIFENGSSTTLNSDSLLNAADVAVWLGRAGAVNLPSGNSYLPGDGNLDGDVDGSDFNIWNSNKFTSSAAWCLGDFNVDGAIDGSDFNVWNGNKFASTDSLSSVPEPCLVGIALAWLVEIWLRPKRRMGLNSKARGLTPLTLTQPTTRPAMNMLPRVHH